MKNTTNNRDNRHGFLSSLDSLSTFGPQAGQVVNRRMGAGAPRVVVLSLVILAAGCGSEADEPPNLDLPSARSANLRESTDEMGIESAAADLAWKMTIPARVFSPSPSLGAKPTSVSDHNSPDYGALKVFFDKAARYTRQRVTFEIASWSADKPNSVIQQVGINNDSVSGVPRDAAYDSGLALNPVWGFLYNSIPFGPDFDRMLRFLDEGGLHLAQALVDARGLNVKLLPVVGSNPQGSGYFKHPIGKADCDGEPDCLHERPIGLVGLCTAGWTWRYYAPALEAIKGACQQLVNERILRKEDVRLAVGVTTPGQSALADVQSEAVTAFEYATPLDDYDPPPSGTGYFSPLTSKPIPLTSQNPGHKGLRFAHHPAWHQPYYIGWMMVNKSAVWDKIPHAFQVAIERAAREAVEESYWYSKSLQCRALRKILDFNDHQVQLNKDGTPFLVNGRPVSADIKRADWPNDALARLKKATDAYLESLKGGTAPTPDQIEFSRVVTAVDMYLKRIHYLWNPRDFDYSECHL